MTYLGLFGALAVALTMQLYLAAKQTQRFMHEVALLRGQGRVAIGLGSNGTFRRKAYLAFAADRDDRVVAAMTLRGLSQFAKPKPVPVLVGLTVEQMAGPGDLPGCDKLLRAGARHAAEVFGAAGGGQPTDGTHEGKEQAARATNPIT